jgi:hypothetical protein
MKSPRLISSWRDLTTWLFTMVNPRKKNMIPLKTMNRFLRLPAIVCIALISLAVAAPPAIADVEISFQEDVNGYMGTVDTFIMESDVSADRGDGDWVEWDADDPLTSGNSNFGLIRFDDIFGPGPNQIPAGSLIVSATLTYVVSDSGDPATVGEVAVDWAENVTYDGFGSDPGVQADEYLTTAAMAGGSIGTQTVDVTASLADWVLDPSANHGWIFLPTGSGGVEFRSSEYLTTLGDRPRLSVTYDDTATLPPDLPVLNAPADDAIGVTVSPLLAVYVSDPEAEDLTVTFRGRELPGVAADDFTLIALPDTQNESQYYPAVFTSQTQWIVDNRSTENIVFVTHLGDIVNTADSNTQWNNADAAMDLLDAPDVFYSVGPGNHDLPLYTATSLYPTYFGTSRFADKSYYGGSYDGDNYNNYSLFSASGMDFILINLQYDPTAAMLAWADSLLKVNADRRGIVASHSILNVNNAFTSEGTAIFDALKDNANLFLMLCGHMYSSSDGAAYREEAGDDGHIIHIMLADYQDFPSGGNGYMRILRFSPPDDKVYATTYSPYTGASITTYPDQMVMDYDMAGNAAFEVIGTVSDVASGEDASISWPALNPDTEYEWYVAVNDGHRTTTGPVWSFTTTAGLAGDFDSDCDADGADLAWLAGNPESMDAEMFAGVFGTIGCP